MSHKRVDILSKIVCPGDVLAVIEEFLPEGAVYETDDGRLISTVVGQAFFNVREHQLKVEGMLGNKPLVLSCGDIVYGEITSLRDSIAVLSISLVEGKGILPVPFTGIIHVTRVSSSYVKNMFEAFRIGDVVRARVASSTGPPYLLTTIGRELGVIYALCPSCVAPLVKKGLSLICSICRKTSKRKLSSLYVTVRRRAHTS